MLVLGLGSNIGDRLNHLRICIRKLKELSSLTIEEVSPVYVSSAMLPENAAADWDIPYLNCAVRCETRLDPSELIQVLKKCERDIGRTVIKKHWGPRIIDIDILCWDDRVIHTELLTIPHAGLTERPFALWPLADVAPFWKYPFTGENYQKIAAELVERWGSRFTGSAPFQTQQIFQRIDTPEIIGIINVTPDSFSDGGKYQTVEAVLASAQRLVNEGATIIDIGAESTAPNAMAITPQEEWQRLKPILTALVDSKKTFTFAPKISVDTRNPKTAEEALALGVDWINDVTGLTQPAMRKLIAHSSADCVIMHHKRIPENREEVINRGENATETVYQWAVHQLDALAADGISKERIIFDPGIGFGKMAEQSLQIIKQINSFQNLGVRVLIGHSRKTFLSLFTGLPFADRDLETTALSLYLANKVDYLRIHNVEMCARAFKFANFFTS